VLRNGIKLDAGRGEQNIFASIPVRLIPTTFISPMARLCRSTETGKKRVINGPEIGVGRSVRSFVPSRSLVLFALVCRVIARGRTPGVCLLG